MTSILDKYPKLYARHTEHQGINNQQPAKVLDMRQVMIMLFFVIIGFLIYSNTFNSPFILDDLSGIQKEPHIRLTGLSLEGIRKAARESLYSSRPMGCISFALNYYFHRYNVMGYHLVNILIHITTGILLYFFLRTTLSIWTKQSGQPANASLIAFFAACIWFVHPIQIQSVTYIIQRMTSMAAMFYILSLMLYAKFRLTAEKRKKWVLFAGCALAGILALGSKPIAVTLPPFILLYEWFFFQDLSLSWLKRHPFRLAGMLILFGLVVFMFLGTVHPVEKIFNGYANRDFTLTQRVLTEFRVVIYYISLLIFPHPSRLNLDHDFPLSHSLVDPFTTLLSIGTITGLMVLAFYLARRERVLSFCILWFFGNLVIESSVIGLEIIFEHRTYLPSMFFFLIIVVLVHRYFKKGWAVTAFLSLWVILLCSWTYERNRLWGNPVAFARDCAQKSPKKARPQNRLGVMLVRHGRLDDAMACYREALRIEPEFAEAHNNLGVALAKQEKLDEALAHYGEALRNRPRYPEAHYGMGVVFAQQQKLDEAILHFTEAVRIDSNYTKAHLGLGVAFAQQGKLDEAMAHLSVAEQITPNNAEVHYNLGLLLDKLGNIDLAMAHYNKALEVKSDYEEVHNNLGTLLAGQGRFDEAIVHFSEALGIRPDFEAARRNLERAQAIAGESK